MRDGLATCQDEGLATGRGVTGRSGRAVAGKNLRPMNHRDAEMTEVVVVLDDLNDEQTDRVAEKLKAAGLEVFKVDHDESLVEGTIETEKVAIPQGRGVRPLRPQRADLHRGLPAGRPARQGRPGRRRLTGRRAVGRGFRRERGRSPAGTRGR